jgi:hypothetical protein
MKETINAEIIAHGYPSLTQTIEKEVDVGSTDIITVEVDNIYQETAKKKSKQFVCDAKGEKFANEIATMSVKLLKIWGVPIY